MEETALAKTLNNLFVDKANEDKAREAALRYVYDRTRYLPTPPEGLVVGLHNISDVIRLYINATVNGKSVQGLKEWTKKSLLATDRPITQLFDEVINKVFEVPSEGASVS